MEMKICPKCNKKMKKALQVLEMEASWWESEGFYVADPDGRSRTYERCLTCGTELQEEIPNKYTETFSELEICWINVSKIGPCGHGVEFHYNSSALGSQSSRSDKLVIGFIDDFEWFNRETNRVGIRVLTRDSKEWGNISTSSDSILKELKECIYIILEEGLKSHKIVRNREIIKGNISSKWNC